MRAIRTLPVSLRPREKLLKRGAALLSLEELCSVILVAGTKTVPVSRLAVATAKCVKQTGDLTFDALKKVGLGNTKAAQILAAVELGRRVSQKSTVTITSAKDVYIHSAEIISQEKESLLCFYLNARGELLKKEVVAVGSLNRASLLPREIFSLVKELPVASVILAHNHPSGNLEPSKQDILFTKRVKQAGDILGVALLDHVIVASSGWKRINW